MARAAAVAASSARASSGRTQSAAAGFGLPARALRLVQEALWIGLAALAAFLLLILLS